MRAGGAVTAGAILVAQGAAASVATTAIGAGESTNPTRAYGKYNVRFRYGRMPGYCGLWMRVSELGNADTPIPFELVTSTTADMKSVVSMDHFFANPRSSYIVRTRVKTAGLARIYVQIRLTNNPKIVSRVWTIHRRGRRTLTHG